MIILYAGSFSPITVGHYFVIINIMKQYPNAIFIIAPVNQKYRKELLPFDDRLAMIELTVKWIHKDHPNWKINPSDFMRNGDKYNDGEWINYNNSIYPHNDIYYLIGSDVDTHTWRQKDQDVLATIHTLIFPRTNKISSFGSMSHYEKTGKLINLIPPVKNYVKEHF